MSPSNSGVAEPTQTRTLMTGVLARPHKKIGLLEHTGYGNFGDDASVASLMQNIRLRWPDAEIVGLTLDPEDTEKQLGLQSYPIRRLYKRSQATVPSVAPSKPALRQRLKGASAKFRLFAKIARFINAVAYRGPRAAFSEARFLIESFRIARTIGVLVISGGGQLRDAGIGPWQFPYTIFKWVVLAKIARARCYFVNVGAGPLRTRTGRWLVGNALKFSDYTSFRDERSQGLVQRLGFSRSSGVYPDCVYALPISSQPIAARSSAAKIEPLVGIAPMKVYWDDDPQVYAYIIRELGKFSVRLAASRYRLELFGTDIWSDHSASTDLLAEIGNVPGGAAASSRIASPPPSAGGIDALLNRISSMDYVVTCRFHGLVFAHLMNKPVLAVSHHPKMATLMNDLGLSEYWIDIRKFDSELLADRFAQMIEKRDEIKARMAERAACYRQTLAAQFDQLFPRQSAEAQR